jgi:hypothetical protein
MAICKVCLATPFNRLPSEERAAYPHQLSIESLEASAATCALCRLILRSVRELQETIENEELDELGEFTQRLARERTGDVE